MDERQDTEHRLSTVEANLRDAAECCKKLRAEVYGIGDGAPGLKVRMHALTVQMRGILWIGGIVAVALVGDVVKRNIDGPERVIVDEINSLRRNVNQQLQDRTDTEKRFEKVVKHLDDLATRLREQRENRGE